MAGLRQERCHRAGPGASADGLAPGRNHVGREEEPLPVRHKKDLFLAERAVVFRPRRRRPYKRMRALPRRPPCWSWSSTCPAESRATAERIRAVIVPSASSCATVVSPSGEIRGFALEAWLIAVICR